MPASKLNYIIVYDNHSQVYGSSSEKIAIESPPPEGLSEKDKNIFFVNYEPDTKNICVYKVNPEDIILQGKESKKKERKE